MGEDEVRLLAAAQADFVVCLYNPSSRKRKDYLQKACDLMMKYKSPDTVCGTVAQIARDGETAQVMTLKELVIQKWICLLPYLWEIHRLRM